jgi:hypothetical protein
MTEGSVFDHQKLQEIFLVYTVPHPECHPAAIQWTPGGLPLHGNNTDH